MAFKHGVSEGAITGFPRSNRIFGGFFQKHLDKWLRPLGISEGALSGINFDATDEKWRRFGATSRTNVKMAPNRSQKLKIFERNA